MELPFALIPSLLTPKYLILAKVIIPSKRPFIYMQCTCTCTCSSVCGLVLESPFDSMSAMVATYRLPSALLARLLDLDQLVGTLLPRAPP